MRQIILDTETTGIDPRQGHRIIEIGCVEMIDRKLTGNHYHVYINPGQKVEQEAIDVHGITNDFLENKPPFTAIANEFLAFIKNSELIIHNAPFDVGFIDNEFSKLKGHYGRVKDYCSVIDTLVLAKKMHPGQKNNLDALCKRYFIDNSSRILHGALLDAEILAEVYLAMTGGQKALSLGTGCDDDYEGEGTGNLNIHRFSTHRERLKVIHPSEDELKMHREKLNHIHQHSGQCLWLTIDSE